MDDRPRHSAPLAHDWSSHSLKGNRSDAPMYFHSSGSRSTPYDGTNSSVNYVSDASREALDVDARGVPGGHPAHLIAAEVPIPEE